MSPSTARPSSVSPSSARPSAATRSAAGRPRRPAEGRERLLDTAERLYAERGITGVSLREITEAAGQRNASVVQYHFGSRAGLVAAIVARHMSVVDTDRNARLDVATATGGAASGHAASGHTASGGRVDVHEVMRILVEPLADELRTESGRHYLRIVQHLVDLPADEAHPGPPLVQTNPSLARTTTLLAGAIAHLPTPLRRERQDQTTSFLLRALADRAAALSGPRPRGRRRPADHEVFVANLVDVLVAVLTTPPSPETLARL